MEAISVSNYSAFRNMNQKPRSPYTLCHAIHRECNQHRAGDDQVFGLNLCRHAADDEHHRHSDHTTGREHETDPSSGIAEILLHQLRRELCGREQDRAGRQHHQKAGTELARRHHTQVNDRIGSGQPPRNHQHERQTANDRERDDEGRAEPVVLQAAVQHDLERAEEGRDQHEADDVEPDTLLLRPGRRTSGARLESSSQSQCPSTVTPVWRDCVGRNPDFACGSLGFVFGLAASCAISRQVKT
jgi:hypothetical protein